MDAWVKAGAQYGWVGSLNVLNFLNFRPAFAGARRSDELPGFNLGNQVSLLPALPVIATPFGLVVAGPLDAAAIAAIARQRALKLLVLEKSTLKDADLGALAGLRLAHLALPESARTDIALRHFLAAREPGPHAEIVSRARF